jgi:hypothetical protein
MYTHMYTQASELIEDAASGLVRVKLRSTENSAGMEGRAQATASDCASPRQEDAPRVLSAQVFL